MEEKAEISERGVRSEEVGVTAWEDSLTAEKRAAIRGMSSALEAGKGKTIDFLPESPEKNTALLTLGFYSTESHVGFLTYKL